MYRKSLWDADPSKGETYPLLTHIINLPLHPRVSEVESSILEFGRPLAQVEVSVLNKKKNNVVPDETASYAPFHLELHCLQYWFWSAGWRNGLKAYAKLSSYVELAEKKNWGENGIINIYQNNCHHM